MRTSLSLLPFSPLANPVGRRSTGRGGGGVGRATQGPGGDGAGPAGLLSWECILCLPLGTELPEHPSLCTPPTAQARFQPERVRVLVLGPGRLSMSHCHVPPQPATRLSGTLAPTSLTRPVCPAAQPAHIHLPGPRLALVDLGRGLPLPRPSASTGAALGSKHLRFGGCWCLKQLPIVRKCALINIGRRRVPRPTLGAQEAPPPGAGG